MSKNSEDEYFGFRKLKEYLEITFIDRYFCRCGSKLNFDYEFPTYHIPFRYDDNYPLNSKDCQVNLVCNRCYRQYSRIMIPNIKSYNLVSNDKLYICRIIYNDILDSLQRGWIIDNYCLTYEGVKYPLFQNMCICKRDRNNKIIDVYIERVKRLEVE